MKFDLIDSLSIPGDIQKANEDAFAEAAHFAVVIDGATNLGENLMPGPSDAQWLARFGARRLAAHARDNLGAPSEWSTPREWVRAAASDAEKSFLAMRRRAPNERYEIPCASLMAVALIDNALSAYWFGDCSLIVKAPDGTIRVVGDAVSSRGAERARVRKLSHGKNPAAAGVREAFLPDLRASRNRVNGNGGAWLFAPEPACADHIKEAIVEAAADATLLIASDGLLALVSDYDRYDAAGLIDAAEKFGLEALGEELRSIERDDPDGAIYPRFKRSDDATGLLLRLAP